MAEQCNLTTPEGAVSATTRYRPVSILLDWEQKRITIGLVGDAGHRKKVVYENATTPLRALNTADLTVKSLHKRVLERLIADGHLAGTISGLPDA